MKISTVLRIKHIDMANIARIERQLDFRAVPIRRRNAPSSSPLYFSSSNSIP
jgi:hypothetical protein